MGEVLSQNEIDSLLQALSNGELDAEDMKEKDEKQVKNYDFTRPAKFSKEHLRTLEIILNTMEDFFDEPACLSQKNSTGGSDEFRGGYLF